MGAPANVNYTTVIDGAGVVRQSWNDATATYREFDPAGAQTLSRAYTAEENGHATTRASSAIVTANATALRNATQLEARLTRLAAYKTDPDLLAVLNQANNTALTTQVLNRALKAIVRENQRQSATVAILVRLIDPALLANVTDTTDS